MCVLGLGAAGACTFTLDDVARAPSDAGGGSDGSASDRFTPDAGGDSTTTTDAPLVEAGDAANVLFEDDFEGRSALGPAWVTHGGNWSLADGGLEQDDTAAVAVYAYAGAFADAGDYVVTARVQEVQALNTNAGVQLVFRVAGSGNHERYICGWYRQLGLIRILQSDDVVPSPRTIVEQSLPGPPDASTFTLEAKAVGTKLECRIVELPGTYVGTDTMLPRGSFGLSTYRSHGRFEYIRVLAP